MLASFLPSMAIICVADMIANKLFHNSTILHEGDDEFLIRYVNVKYLFCIMFCFVKGLIPEEDSYSYV